MNIIARKTSEFLSLRRESALCAFAMLGLSHSFFYMVSVRPSVRPSVPVRTFVPVRPSVLVHLYTSTYNHKIC
jgi:hypothetical protein